MFTAPQAPVIPNNTTLPSSGITAARKNTGVYENRSTSAPVSHGNSIPLSPPAIPVSAVTRPTALLSNKSEIVANIFADRNVCPSRTTQIQANAPPAVVARATAMLNRHRNAPSPMVTCRVLRKPKPRRNSTAAASPPTMLPMSPNRNGTQANAPMAFSVSPRSRYKYSGSQ